MIQTSFQNVSALGITLGSAGLRNYSAVLTNPNLPGIMVRTVVWVAVVVGVTVLIAGI